MFGAGSDPAAETEDTLREDPDSLLVSRVLERVVLPKITGTAASRFSVLPSEDVTT